MAIDQITADAWGPCKILYVTDQRADLHGIVVVDNIACGPGIGGVRMAPDLSVEEVARLARAMTWKNAAAGLSNGGAKAGIIADPKKCDKENLIRAFARSIRTLSDYIPGPDMGTDEKCMAWISDEIGRAVGLPLVLGGIPLDKIGATGFGLAQCAEVAGKYCGLEIRGATMAIEGFGSVGRHAARFLEQMGAKLVAASDTAGAIYEPNGIPVTDLASAKDQSGTVTGYPHGRKMPAAELFSLPCDILIPAARPDCIRADNAEAIRAKLVLEGANIPATPEAEAILHRRGVLVVPDFIANAGGVICAAVEHGGGGERAAFEQIAEKIRRNTEEVLERSRRESREPRSTAMEIAQERVLAAMSYRTTAF
jgi:glutamate dehydrogenase/leucine dehydrogenase